METEFFYNGLKFEYLNKSHLPKIVKMLKKESVCEWVFFGPNTEEETLEYFTPFVSSMTEAVKNGRQPDSHVFAIKKDGEFLGECALLAVGYSEGNYIIGYQLDDKYWGKKYGLSSCEFLVNFAFNKLKAYRITGDCMAGNIGSRKIMEKCGFKLEGRQRNHWNKNGKLHDNLLFGLLKEEFSAANFDK